MKIGFLTQNIDPSSGGWGRFAHELIYKIKESGHEVVILKEINDGKEGYPVLSNRWGIVSSVFKASKILRDCDVIHALDGYPYAIIGALVNLRLKKKFIITAQGTYAVAPLYNFFTGIILRWSYKKADKVVAISNFTKSQVLKKASLKNIDVIKHGIEIEKFLAPRIEPNKNYIMSVGGLKKRKGYHISITAFAKLSKKMPDLRYVIVGDQIDKTYFRSLKNIVKHNKIEDRVDFLTNISENDLRKLYQGAKLFVLTSVNDNYHFEGFGLVFLEAAAAGLPVIGTFDNGIEDAVNNGENGILVPQNDINFTAKAIEDILGDQDRWTEMSEHSYDWVKQNTLDKEASDYIKVYENI